MLTIDTGMKGHITKTDCNINNEMEDCSSCDCDQTYVSQITLDDELSEDFPTCSTLNQPSLAPTFISDDESDSFDPIVRKISDEELSISLDNVVLRNMPSSFNDLGNDGDHRSSARGSNDRLNITERRSFSHNPHHSKRIRDLKNKLRSIEKDHQNWSSTTTTSSALIHSTEPDTHEKYPLSTRTHKSNHLVSSSSCRETNVVGDIVCTGLAASFFCLTSIISCQAISAMLQGSHNSILYEN